MIAEKRPIPLDFSARLCHTGHKSRVLAVRGVAQLIARSVWDREVEGLSPFTPTMKDFQCFCLNPPSNYMVDLAL